MNHGIFTFFGMSKLSCNFKPGTNLFNDGVIIWLISSNYYRYATFIGY